MMRRDDIRNVMETLGKYALHQSANVVLNMLIDKFDY